MSVQAHSRLSDADAATAARRSPIVPCLMESSALSKIVPEERARQGRKGTQVLTILVVSLVLLAIGWFFVGKYGESIDAKPTQLQTSQ